MDTIDKSKLELRVLESDVTDVSAIEDDEEIIITLDNLNEYLEDIYNYLDALTFASLVHSLKDKEEFKTYKVQMNNNGFIIIKLKDEPYLFCIGSKELLNIFNIESLDLESDSNKEFKEFIDKYIKEANLHVNHVKKGLLEISKYLSSK